MSNPIVSFRWTTDSIDMVDTIAEKRGMTRTEALRMILEENLHRYEELSSLEQELAEVKKKERRDKLEREITKRKIKEATWMQQVSGIVQNMERAGASKKEILEVLDSMMPTARRRDKETELQSLIETVEEHGVTFEVTKNAPASVDH